MSFEKISPEETIKKLAFIAEKEIECLGAQFFIQGGELTSEEASAHNGMLPLLMHRAAIVFEDMYGKPMSLGFQVDKAALCEAVPTIEPLDKKHSFAEYAHCLHTAIEDMVRAAPTPKNGIKEVKLDSVYDDWFEKLRGFRYKVLPPKEAPAPSNTTGGSGH